MANVIYNLGKNNILEGNIDLLADTIKAILVDLADYTFNQAHENLDDVLLASRVAEGTLLSKTLTAGVFDAADLVLSSVSGDTSEAVILYKDSGVESTSHLIAYYDTFAAGMPVTPNTGDITIVWSSGASKILKI